MKKHYLRPITLGELRRRNEKTRAALAREKAGSDKSGEGREKE